MATATAPMRLVAVVVANAASQSCGPGTPDSLAIEWNSASETTAVNAKFARLNERLSVDVLPPRNSATPAPVSSATR